MQEIRGIVTNIREVENDQVEVTLRPVGTAPNGAQTIATFRVARSGHPQMGQLVAFTPNVVG